MFVINWESSRKIVFLSSVSHSTKWLNPRRGCGNLWFIASLSEKQEKTIGIQLVSEGGDGSGVHSVRTELNCRRPSWHPENQSVWWKAHLSGVTSAWEVLYKRRNTKFFPFQDRSQSVYLSTIKRPDVEEGKVAMKSSVSDAFQGTPREMLTR